MSEPYDSSQAENKKNAVFIGQQATGATIMIGREDKEEWLSTQDMVPLDLKEVR
jgi:hypothetical protein